jgi:hypothetical protein
VPHPTLDAERRREELGLESVQPPAKVKPTPGTRLWGSALPHASGPGGAQRREKEGWCSGRS